MTTEVERLRADNARLLRECEALRANYTGAMLSVDQCCEVLCVTRRTFFRLVKLGKIAQPVRYSRKLVRWREAEIKAALERGV